MVWVTNVGLSNAKTGAAVFTPCVILERSLVDEAGAKQTIKFGVIGFVPPQLIRQQRQMLRCNA